jgi:hypothetical protein
VHAWASPRLTAGWASPTISRMPARALDKEFQWSKSTPCTGEPESQARCVC